jgi:tRNA threonylcarbamoyladenosine biosynthesis protein TsaE
MQQKYISKSPDDLPVIAAQLLQKYPGNRVFAFYGQMGAGKTTFIKALCQIPGTTDNVSSPTFSIINAYVTKDGREIFHFDFYRIQNLAEAIDIGSEEYFYSGHYCFLEWPEHIEDILPEDTIKVRIEVGAEKNERFFYF